MTKFSSHGIEPMYSSSSFIFYKVQGGKSTSTSQLSYSSSIFSLFYPSSQSQQLHTYYHPFLAWFHQLLNFVF
jgi:hypothetical protein